MAINQSDRPAINQLASQQVVSRTRIAIPPLEMFRVATEVEASRPSACARVKSGTRRGLLLEFIGEELCAA